MRKKRSFYASEKEQTVTDYELNLVFLWNTYIAVSRYPAAGNCFQKTRYPAVRNFDQFSRNSSFNPSKNIRYLFRNLKRL